MRGVYSAYGFSAHIAAKIIQYMIVDSTNNEHTKVSLNESLNYPKIP